MDWEKIFCVAGSICCGAVSAAFGVLGIVTGMPAGQPVWSGVFFALAACGGYMAVKCAREL